MSQAIETSLENIPSQVTVWFQVTVELPATERFPATEAFPPIVVAQATVKLELRVVAPFVVNEPVTVSLPEIFTSFNEVVPLAIKSQAETVPVKLEVQVTDKFQEAFISVAFTHLRAEVPFTFKFQLIVASLLTVTVFVVVDVATNVAIVQLLVVNVPVEVHQVIDKSALPVIFHPTFKVEFNVVAQVTQRVPPTEALQVVDSVFVATLSEVIEVEEIDWILQVVEVTLSKVPLVQLIACQVISQLAVMAHSIVNGQFTVKRLTVTLDKSKVFIDWIAFFKFSSGKDT